MARGGPRMRLAVPDGQRRKVCAIGVSADRVQTPWSAAFCERRLPTTLALIALLHKR